MGKVRNILHNKGNEIFSVEPTTMVYRAIEMMCEKNIGGLLIVEDKKLVGIFTERDYARKLILKGTIIEGYTDPGVDDIESCYCNP